MTRPPKRIPPHLIAHLEWHPGMPTPWLSPAPIPPSPSSPQILPSLVPIVRAFIVKDYIALYNVRCTDADGSVFEQYDRLGVSPDVFRDKDQLKRTFTAYDAIVHCERNGFFLPSLALTCNIVAALYRTAVRKEADGTYTTLDENVKKILDQYKWEQPGRINWYCQNTLTFIDDSISTVIHYPQQSDFPQILGPFFNPKPMLNQNHRRRELSFPRVNLQECLLEEALQRPAHTRYVKQLTGLIDPSILIEIGNYFNRPAKLWPPRENPPGVRYRNTTAGYFGCGGHQLDIICDRNPEDQYSVRGVLELPLAQE